MPVRISVQMGQSFMHELIMFERKTTDPLKTSFQTFFDLNRIETMEICAKYDPGEKSGKDD